MTGDTTPPPADPIAAALGLDPAFVTTRDRSTYHAGVQDGAAAERKRIRDGSHSLKQLPDVTSGAKRGFPVYIVPADLLDDAT